MITIRGTDKIKGVLDLSGINKQLTATQTLPISEKEFTDYTVQLAIKMGLITFEHNGMMDIPTDTSIKVKNIYDRSIRINFLNNEVRPGQVFTLTADQINSSDIRAALAKGLLKIVSSAHPVADDESTDVKVGDIFEEEQNEDVLETNEEITNATVIDSDTPEVIQKKDIPDPKRKTVIWNPNKDPIAHTQTGMDAITANKSGEIKNDESNVEVEIDTIQFVDEELDQKRRKSHPVLKNKPVESDGELDFL